MTRPTTTAVVTTIPVQLSVRGEGELETETLTRSRSFTGKGTLTYGSDRGFGRRAVQPMTEARTDSESVEFPWAAVKHTSLLYRFRRADNTC